MDLWVKGDAEKTELLKRAAQTLRGMEGILGSSLVRTTAAALDRAVDTIRDHYGVFTTRPFARYEPLEEGMYRLMQSRIRVFLRNMNSLPQEADGTDKKD